MVVGNVRVVKVDGTAWQIMGGNGQRERLKEGDFLRQGNTVVTDSKSTVLLLFQNGSTINLQPGTKFSIAQFLHDPFETERVDYRKISSEPSRSTTRVEVREGTITAKIPKLQRASSYSIATPLGTAGIRGTVVTVSVNPNAATFVVTEGMIQVTKDGRSFWVSEGDRQQAEGDTRTGRQGNLEEETIVIATDPDYTPPAGEIPALNQLGQQAGENAGQSIPQNPFEGAPQQQAGSGNAQSGTPTDAGTDGGGGTGGSGGGSPPALPGGFGGGGGGGGGGGSTGGGSQYSTR